MEKSSKILLKYIMDLDMEFTKIEDTFNKKDFLPITKLNVEITSDIVRLIYRAFNVTDELKEEKIFEIYNKLYEKQITTEEAINEIENVLK